MASPGDYTKNRVVFQDVSTDLTATASTDDTTLITSRNNAHQIFVQRIIVFVTTDAAVSWSFEDESGVQIFGISASPGVNTRWDFDGGPEGFPLTAGENLVLNVSATGLAGHVHVEAYERLTPNTVIAAAST